MGLIFPSRRRRGSSGLVVLLILAVVATPWLLSNSGMVMMHCQNTAQSMQMGHGVCNGFAQMAKWFGGAAVHVGDVSTASSEGLQARWENWQTQLDESLKERWAAINYRMDAGQSWVGGNPLSRYTPTDMVTQMLKTGKVPDFGGGAEGQLRSAMSHFSAGQASMGSNPRGAMSWYKQGADMGEYGLMSQLKLGSIFMQDGGSVDMNMDEAYRYNSEALNSLQTLEASNTPEADAMLRGLPVEPRQLKEQLRELLRKMKATQ